MARADVIGALVALLKADTAVAALAGTRVFGGELPRGEAASMPRSAIVVQPSGGASLTAGSYLPHDTQRIDLRCYGVVPFEANVLMGVAGDAMRGIRRTVSAGCLMHWADPTGGLSARRDADTKWPFAFQSFQVFHALEALA